MTNGTEDERFAGTRQQVSDWLMAEGWSLRNLTQQAEGAAWAVQGTNPGKRIVIFAQHGNKPDVLMMQAAITVNEPNQARLARLGTEKAEDLAWQIRFQLLNMGVKFAGLSLPLRRFELVLRVYTDDLRRNGFFDRVDRLLDAVNASLWLIGRALAQPAPDTNGTDPLDIN